MFCSIYLLIKNNLYNILYLIINKIYWSYTINTQLVIFDLDGTLCDTFDDIYLSLKHTLDNFNVFTPSLDEVKSFIGDGLALLIERTLNVTNQAYLKNDILASFMQYYKEHCTDSTLLFPGMENVLKELYRKNVYMAVVSNKAYHLVDIIIKELDLYDYFKFVYGGDSFDEKKPSAKPLLNIINSLSVIPDNSFMIGDSDNDVLAGAAAGMKTIYCSYGYAPLKKSTSDYIVDNPLDILNFIR